MIKMTDSRGDLQFNGKGSEDMKKLSVVAWVVALCELVSEYQHFTGTYCLSPLKMEIICSSETLVPTYQTIWCQNPEDHHQFQCSENFQNCLQQILNHTGSLVFSTFTNFIVRHQEVENIIHTRVQNMMEGLVFPLFP
jgi:hypothetical protein